MLLTTVLSVGELGLTEVCDASEEEQACFVPGKAAEGWFILGSVLLDELEEAFHGSRQHRHGEERFACSHPAKSLCALRTGCCHLSLRHLPALNPSIHLPCSEHPIVRAACGEALKHTPDSTAQCSARQCGKASYMMCDSSDVKQAQKECGEVALL